jgi:hypothetical protein
MCTGRRSCQKLESGNIIKIWPLSVILILPICEDEEIEQLISLRKDSSVALGIGIDKQVEVRLDIQGKHHEIDY